MPTTWGKPHVQRDGFGKGPAKRAGLSGVPDGYHGNNGPLRDTFCVFVPGTPGKTNSIPEVVDCALEILGDQASDLHMAYPVNGALTLALKTDAAAAALVATAGAKFKFFRGERRGSLVRLYGLPWTATYESVYAALQVQLGAVNHLVLRSYPGTSVLTGDAIAWVSLREGTPARSRGVVSIHDRSVRCKIDNPMQAPPLTHTERGQRYGDGLDLGSPLERQHGQTQARLKAHRDRRGFSRSLHDVCPRRPGYPRPPSCSYPCGSRSQTDNTVGLQVGFPHSKRPTQVTRSTAIVQILSILLLVFVCRRCGEAPERG